MLGGYSVGGVSVMGTTSGGVADTSQAHIVTQNTVRSGSQGRRGPMIVCTEDSVCRTMIRKEHPNTLVYLSVGQQQNSITGCKFFRVSTLDGPPPEDMLGQQAGTA